MKVDCTSDHELTLADLTAVLASCWPDLRANPRTLVHGPAKEDDKPRDSWTITVPQAIAARIRNQEQARWQNSATVALAGVPTTVTLTFDPGTAEED